MILMAVIAQNKYIGILAMQGAIAEHQRKIEQLPHTKSVLVKTAEDLEKIDGLILPGGESTAMGKLLNYFKLTEQLKNKIKQGLPVWGTCAGMILLAKEIENEAQTHLAVMNIKVRRNAYGSQLDSFYTEKIIPEINTQEALPLVFIRAPYITKADDNVQILAKLNDNIIAAQENNMLVTSFHPELTDKLNFHQYFRSLI